MKTRTRVGVGALVGAFCVVALAVGLFSCDGGSGSGGDLEGTWSDGYGTTTISAASIKYVSGFNMGDYTGSIANTPKLTAASGVLIIKFSAPSSLSGKYGARYWKSLKSTTVLMADVYTPDWSTLDSKATLAEAEAAFSNANVGNYVDWSGIGPYTKQ
jgi:hypothetical protein